MLKPTGMKILHLAVALALAVVCTFPAAALGAEQDRRPSIPASERSALLALYAATDGPHWLNKQGWGDPAGTECEWEGVFCDDDGSRRTVVGLDLGANRLTGGLPDELDLLANLNEFVDNSKSGRRDGGYAVRDRSGRAAIRSWREDSQCGCCLVGLRVARELRDGHAESVSEWRAHRCFLSAPRFGPGDARGVPSRGTS